MALLEPPSNLYQLLRDSFTENNRSKSDSTAYDDSVGEDDFIVLSYMTFLASGLADENNFEPKTWKDVLEPYLIQHYEQKRLKDCFGSDATNGTNSSNRSSRTSVDTDKIVADFCSAAERALTDQDDAESYGDPEDDGVEVVCDVRFNLAYGGKILLHQTKLHLLRGRRYALVGQNGVGKTTLMNAINTGKIDGWPTHLVTAYVDSGSNVDPVYMAQNVLQYVTAATSGKLTPEECAEKLQSPELQFTDSMLAGTIGELSGGWQMKLKLARATMTYPPVDVFLLDEPTNHLSGAAVQWITSYLQTLTYQTVLMVSHDTNFLEAVATDVIHYEQRSVWGPYRKLVHYKGKMSEFVLKQPQAKHYFELATTDSLKFEFPEPGRLEGVKTSTQKFMELQHVDFRYPGASKNNLTDVNLKLTLSSRVVVLGANGAGKTTLIKMIVGETVPSNLNEPGTIFYVHPNLRIAYVAQHAFNHVEQHMDESPVAYIQWRFKDGFDQEKMESEAYRITPEDQKAIDDFNLEGIWSRRVRGGVLEYEVKKKNIREKDNKYFSRDELLAMGFEHLIKQTDEKIAAKEAGLDLRPVTTSEIQKHLDGFGLPQEFGTYGRIRGLSGGQKVKLVLAAAFWTVPHLVVMDEPTNFLDREALGALSAALNSWGGAVLMISHNHEFYSSVCREEWLLEDGRLIIQGVSTEREMKAVARKKKYDKEADSDEVLDKAGGNVNVAGDKAFKDATINFWGKTVSKKDARNYEKAKKKGDIDAMRKILEIPKGKIMAGMEELGDGLPPKKDAK